MSNLGSLSYCLQDHRFPSDGQQPAACFYNEDNDFFGSTVPVPPGGSDGNLQSTVYLFRNSVVTQEYQYDQNGNRIAGDAAYLNVDSTYVPPNYNAVFYSDADCKNEIGNIVGSYAASQGMAGSAVTSGDVDQAGTSVGCIKLERPYSWDAFKDGCRLGTVNSEFCQQFLGSTADSGVNNVGENGTSVGLSILFYVLVGIFIVVGLGAVIYSLIKRSRKKQKQRIERRRKELQERQRGEVNKKIEAGDTRPNIWNTYVNWDKIFDTNVPNSP